MAKKVELRYKPKDFESYRNSKEVRALLKEEADKVKAAADAIASGKYEVKVSSLPDRAYAVVKATTKHACASNARHNTLLKALKGGR